jgi:CRP-like cAMP-binding protein
MTEKILRSLKLIDLLADLPDPFLQTLARFSMLRQVRAGETIFCQGEPSPYCFGILSGQITIQRVPKERTFAPKILSILGPGCLFGERSLFKDSPRTAMAIASQNGELIAIQGKQFRDWIEKEPGSGVQLMMGLLQNTMVRLRQTSHELSLVYGTGRYLASDKPLKDRFRETADFLRASIQGVDEITIYQRNPYWDEYEPLVSVGTHQPATAPLPMENPLVKQVAALLRPVVPSQDKTDNKDQATALIPLIDHNNHERPLLGFFYVISRSNPLAFSPNILLLLDTVSVQFTEALLHDLRQQDQAAQSRLQQSRQSYSA